MPGNKQHSAACSSAGSSGFILGFLNESPKKTREKAYQELIAYLSAEEKNRLEEMLLKRPQNISLDLTSQKIQSGEWASLFNHANAEHFPLTALACLREGKISSMQFATSQLFFNVWRHPENKGEVKSVSVFLNNTAKNVIDATMRIASTSKRAYLEKAMELTPNVHGYDQFFKAWDEFFKANTMDWSEEEAQLFYQKLKALPASEHKFLIVPDPLFDVEKIKKAETSVIQQINYRLGFNVFSRFRAHQKPMCMIPSRGMMQTYLEVPRGKNTPTPIYRMGLSTVEGLHNTFKKEQKRDMFLSFPLLQEYPEIVDGHKAHPQLGEAELHDFYHQMRIADIPLKDRKLFNFFSDCLLEIAKNHPEYKVISFYLAEQLIDMEHIKYDRRITTIKGYGKLFPQYKKTDDNDPLFKFWVSVHVCQLLTEKKFPKKFREQFHALAKLMVGWLLEHEQALSNHGLPLVQILNVNFPAYDLFHRVAAVLQQRIENLTQDRSLAELVDLYNKNSSRLMKNSIYRQMKILIKQDIQTAFSLASTHKTERQLTNTIVDVLVENFKKFEAEGKLHQLREDYPKLFSVTMKALMITPFGDKLIKDAIEAKEKGRQTFDLLYDQDAVNRVFKSDNTTLLNRAVEAANVEVLLRLTNDGASIKTASLCGANKPFTQAFLSSHLALFPILWFAYQHGKDWMQEEPEALERIHRLDKAFQTSLSNEREDDEEWSHSLREKHAASIPPQWMNFTKMHEASQWFQMVETTHHNFLSDVKRSGKNGRKISEEELVLLSDAHRWLQSGQAAPSKSCN